jgi:hypothetical protein
MYRYRIGCYSADGNHGREGVELEHEGRFTCDELGDMLAEAAEAMCVLYPLYFESFMEIYRDAADWLVEHRGFRHVKPDAAFAGYHASYSDFTLSEAIVRLKRMREGSHDS